MSADSRLLREEAFVVRYELSTFRPPLRNSSPMMKRLVFLVFLCCLCSQYDLLFAQGKQPGAALVDSLHAQTDKLKEVNAEALHKVEAVQKTLRNQKLLLILAAILFVLFFLMGVPFYLNYKKVRIFSEALKQKNMIIQKNAASLDQLNRAISRQNQKLEEDNKLKDKLLSIISHDLRHPLVNTKSILDLINLKLVSPKETEELLEQLENQYVRSLSLLDNLLFWIRGQMKGLKIERTRVNMHRLTTTLTEEQRIPIQNKQIKVINHIDKNLEWRAEREMLKIIFRNLITNAIKFTPSEGEILLTSVIDETFAYILIKDTGIGMAKETLAKVNARQYVSTKGTSNEKGSGFGLILVKDLIEKNEAELLIESEQSRGSTIAVKFKYEKE